MIKFCEALVNVNFLTAAASRCGQTYTFDSRFAPEKLTAQYTGPCSMGWRILLRIFSMRISIASHAFREGSSVVIVYRELSSLVSALGFSAKTLYGVSNRVTTHYRQLKIPKSNGGFRTLHIPDQLLKSIQRQINLQLLLPEPVSPFATAYRPGGSTRINALPHVGKPIVLKLDIDHFFDHAFYPLVKEKAFPAMRYSEKNRILLSLLCTYKDTLPQGAPTSPAISNMIMYDFDMAVGKWCVMHNVSYTRYCDDMTFSGMFDIAEVIAVVKDALKDCGFFLNARKTTVIRSSQRQTVTGLVVNEQVHIPSSYRNALRQELYYCRKFGIQSHLEHRHIKMEPEAYALSLLGKINYCLTIHAADLMMLEMKQWLMQQIRNNCF